MTRFSTVFGIQVSPTAAGGGGGGATYPYNLPLQSIASTGVAGDWTNVIGPGLTVHPDGFWGFGDTETGDYTQVITLPSDYHADADAGLIRAAISHEVKTFESRDVGVACLEFFDNGGAFLGRDYTPVHRGTSAAVMSRSDIFVPPGTRSISCSWQGGRTYGTELSAYVKDMAVVLTKVTDVLSSVVAYKEDVADLTGWTILSGAPELRNIDNAMRLGHNFYMGGSQAYGHMQKPIAIPAGWAAKIASGNVRIRMTAHLFNWKFDDDAGCGVEFVQPGVNTSIKTGRIQLSDLAYPVTLDAAVPSDATSFLLDVEFWRDAGTSSDGSFQRPSLILYEVPAAPAASADLTVTIPAGKIASDLTDFPVMLDLAEMPAVFWNDVDASGGNIRAYQSDGTTLIPHDVTYIDKDAQQGRMFIKHTLTAAAATDLRIILENTGTAALAATDPNGRNGVWSDYDVVQVFPEVLNRVNGNAPNISPVPMREDQRFIETKRMSLTASQGGCFDGTHYYTVSTNTLRKYNITGGQVAINNNPNGDVNTAAGLTSLDHAGAPDIIDGELWVPIQEYPNSPYDTQYIGRFSLADLTFIGHLELTGATRESSGFYYDADLDRLYVTDYTVDTGIPYFNKTTGVYIADLPLSANISNMQGMTEMDGKYYINSGGDGVYEVEKDGTNNGLVIKSFYSGDDEDVFAHDGDLIHTQDSGYLRHYTKVGGFQDFGRIHGDPLAYTIPRASIWTVAATWLPTPSVNQQGIVGVCDAANRDLDRHSLMFDNRISAWSTSDGWFAPNPDTNPVAYDLTRAGLAHNGTTERKLFANGNKDATGTPSSVCPAGGTDMNIELAGGSGSQKGFGHYQYMWARSEYMSDDWMAADALNTLAPSMFCIVRETSVSFNAGQQLMETFEPVREFHRRPRTVVKSTGSAMRVEWNTDDGLGRYLVQRDITLSNGEAIVWNLTATVPAINYCYARGFLLDAGGSYTDFGLVYDNQYKLGVTDYTAARAYTGHQVLTVAGNDATWFRVYRPSAGGNLVWQTSTDGTTWTTRKTLDRNPVKFGIIVENEAGHVRNEKVTADLLSFEHQPTGAPV